MLKINELVRLHLGIKEENQAQTITIDMSAWAKTYPNGTAVILHKRHGDQTKGLTGATYDRETQLLTWTPTSYDTFYEGYGIAEIRMMEGDVIKKSKDLIVTAVCPSTIDGSGSVTPAGYQEFLNTVIAAKEAAEDAQAEAEVAQEAAEDAAAAAEAATIHQPYIDDETGNWMVWSNDDEEYVDTGIHAQGPKGDPGSLINAYASNITMDPDDSTTIKQELAKKPMKPVSSTDGNFAALDENGNLTDSGHKHSDYVTDKTDKADKVTGATSGNFAGLDANGNLTDSGHKHSDYITDTSDKVDKDQGSENEGKILGIDSSGLVTPINFQGSDFTGATASTAGVHGYVPAPAAGDQLTYLRGDGTWDNPPGSKPITIALDTVTNVSGSYTHTTASEYATSNMKPIQIEVSDPDVFKDSITVTVTDGYVTLSCSSVAGTSDVSVVVMKQLDPNEGDPPAVTSTEFDILANRIGTLGNLTTTAKTNTVAAINELDADITSLNSNLTATNDRTLTKRYYSAYTVNSTNVSWSWGAGYLQLCGDVVFLSTGASPSSASNDWVNLFTLESGYKPNHEVRCAASAEDGSEVRVVRVTSDGKIDIYKPSTKAYWFEITWLRNISN